MKKLILVFATIAISAGAYAQSDSTNKRLSSPDINNANYDINQNRGNDQNQNVQNKSLDKSFPDGVMMQNGKIMMVKNGQLTVLDHEMTMSNGTKIMGDGTYIKKDGTRIKLKDGQHIDMSGNLKINNDKNMYIVPDSIWE